MIDNSFHLTQEVCNRLYDYDYTYLQVSIDGLREKYDYLHKHGSFDVMWARLSLLHKAGISSAIVVTVSHLNIKEVPDIANIAVEHCAGVFILPAMSRQVLTKQMKSSCLSMRTAG